MIILVFKYQIKENLQSIYQILIQLKLEEEQQDISIQKKSIIFLHLLERIIQTVMKFKVKKTFQEKQ